MLLLIHQGYMSPCSRNTRVLCPLSNTLDCVNCVFACAIHNYEVLRFPATKWQWLCAFETKWQWLNSGDQKTWSISFSPPSILHPLLDKQSSMMNKLFLTKQTHHSLNHKHSVVRVWPDYMCHVHTMVVWEIKQVSKRECDASWRPFWGQTSPDVPCTQLKSSRNDLHQEVCYIILHK